MRVIFAGTPETAIPSLNALVESSHDVVAVVTRPDARTGRGRNLKPSPVKMRAQELELPVITTSPRDPNFLSELDAFKPDVAIVVAYGALLPKPVVDHLDYGWINLHFSLLPAWRGAAPVQHAILAGDEVTGASTFLIEEGLDTGPVLGVFTETIKARDTTGSLLERLAGFGAGLVVKTLDAIVDGTILPQAQPAEGISIAPKLTSEDAYVDFAKPAFIVDRVIRGCSPAPGAWVNLQTSTAQDAQTIRLGLGPVEISPDADPLPPGHIRIEKKSVTVGTATHPVVLGTVKAPGKQFMLATDWARGARLSTQAHFLSAGEDIPSGATETISTVRPHHESA